MSMPVMSRRHGRHVHREAGARRHSDWVINMAV